ncbi:MAG: HAD family hydrolase [bacterium]|nr:HAD family hydrolase [bacterium]
MAQKLVVFTSLFNSEMGGIKDLLVFLGRENEVRKIDREYQIRKLLGPFGLEELAELYQGFSEDELKGAAFEYCRKNIIKGMKEFLLELKSQGFLIGVLSSDPQFMMDISKEILGFDFAEGSHLEFQNNIASGRLKKKVDRFVKAEILKEKIIEYSLVKEKIMGIGRATVVNLPIANETNFFVGFDVGRETIDDVIEAIRDNKNLAQFLSL